MRATLLVLSLMAAATVISPAGDATRPIAAIEQVQLGPVTIGAALPSVVPLRWFWAAAP